VSLPSARGQLKSSLAQLKVTWEQLRPLWNDPVSRGFERDFLLPLEPAARATMAAMDKMGDLLARCRHDCE
jgi:hypothetical protein